MSGEIKITGLASGIDFDSLVKKLIEAEGYQAKKLETWKGTWQTKIDKLNELNTNVDSIRTANDKLRTASSFVSRIASNSDGTVADIAVDSKSSQGAYKLDVATTVKHKLGSKGVSSVDSIIADAAGTFDFSDGEGNNINVIVTDFTTLSELKTTIENELTSVGSHAKVDIINDGSDMDAYRIQLTSGVAGIDGKINVTNDDTNLSFTKASYDSDVEQIKGESYNLIDPTGTYNGNINKRLKFKVLSTGTVGSTNVKIQWTDLTENKTGTITVNQAGDYAITQGFKISVGAGTLTKNDEFAIDLFHPDLQQAQNTGLAQSGSVTHSGLMASNAVVSTTAGVFSYSYGGNEIAPLQIPANTTLDKLVKIINEDAKNPGVVASIINDGLGTSQSFHMILTGKNSGAANQIEVTQSTLSNMSTSDFVTTRQATNAMVKIDDYPPDPDSWLQKASNLITDIIPNASVTLKSSGSTNVTIKNDTEAMADKVEDFVTAFNTALDYIDEITKIVLDEKDEASTEDSGILVGNYGVNIVKSKLRSYIGERAVGFDSDEDTYSLLTQVGLTSGDDKRLAFDREAFIDALNDNPDKVVELFSADKIGSTDNSIFTYTAGLSTTKAGTYEVETVFENDEIKTVRYRKKGDSTWYDSTKNKDVKISTDKTYFTIFGGDARGAMISTANGGTGTQTMEFRVKEGRAQTFENQMDELFDNTEGITKVLTNNYEGIIKNIDKRIDRENRRLVQVTSRLQEKFARLETNMQNLNGQMSRLQSQLSSLPTNSG